MNPFLPTSVLSSSNTFRCAFCSTRDKAHRFAGLIIVLSAVFVSGCNDYWWSRGQAPAPKSVLERADQRLSQAMTARSYPRDEVREVARQVQSAFAHLRSPTQLPREFVLRQLAAAQTAFRSLEGGLSYGSRPAYGELSGQLRALSADLQNSTAPTVSAAETSSVNLFAARTLFFLADELSVPAPVAPASVAG